MGKHVPMHVQTQTHTLICFKVTLHYKRMVWKVVSVHKDSMSKTLLFVR